MKKDSRAERGKADPALEIIKARVEERLKAANLSRNEASRRAVIGLTYVNDLLAGKSKNPQRSFLAKLGNVLDTDVAYFYGEQDVPRIGTAAPLPAASKQDVTLYEAGLSDPDGFFKLDESQKTTVSLPFAGSADLYCVEVPDDTMAPRYRAGEVVIVNPRKRAAHGGFAIIRQSDNRVAIREVVAIDTDRISVRRCGADQIIDLPRDKVVALERIIGTCELG